MKKDSNIIDDFARLANSTFTGMVNVKNELLEYIIRHIERLVKNMNFVTEGNGYFQIQASRPQTLAYGLNDSPIGLLAWLIEKRRSWSDCNGDIESRFSKDDLINTAMIYWLSESFGTSARYYYEAIHNIWKPSHDRHPMVESITGFTIFEGDVIFRPRKWMEKEHNIKYWNVKSSGGHFAPMEEPEVLIDEIRKFFNPYRSLI